MMDQKYIVVGLLIIVALILISTHCIDENFTSRREKAVSIFDWFNKNPTPLFVNYKRDLNRSSNIVEYEDSLALLSNKNLTVESIEKIL
jgi:hypothetical protein